MSKHTATMKTEFELLIWDGEDVKALVDFAKRPDADYHRTVVIQIRAGEATARDGDYNSLKGRNYITFSKGTGLEFHTREEFHEKFIIKEEIRFHGIEGQRVTGLLETATFIETTTPDPEWVFDGSNPRPYNDIPNKLEDLEARVGYDYNSNHEGMGQLVENAINETGLYGPVDELLAEKFKGSWLLDDGEEACVADSIDTTTLDMKGFLYIGVAEILKDWKAVYIGEVTPDEASKYLKAWNNRGLPRLDENDAEPEAESWETL